MKCMLICLTLARILWPHSFHVLCKLTSISYGKNMFSLIPIVDGRKTKRDTRLVYILKLLEFRTPFQWYAFWHTLPFYIIKFLASRACFKYIFIDILLRFIFSKKVMYHTRAKLSFSHVRIFCWKKDMISILENTKYSLNVNILEKN